MKKLVAFSLLAILSFTTSCKEEVKDKDKVETKVKPKVETKKVKIKLEPKSGSTVKGTAVFTETDGIVEFTAILEGFQPNTEHAIHIHEKADCSSDDGKSTGGHWNPTGQPHGKWGSKDGFHIGDIGNLVADNNGNVIKKVKTNLWCIGCGDPNKDVLGKAIILHAGIDDFTTQPTGAAGGRVSCGGIIE